MKQARIINFQEPRMHLHDGKVYKVATWRKKIIQRDHNCCQICNNSIQDEFRNRKFSNEAHHIIPRRHGGKNTLKNGVTLCKFCHMYYDRTYSMTGLDYFQLFLEKSKDRIMMEVKQLLKKRYVRHLVAQATYEEGYT